jgi:O-antigen/teichoic acid export membrane protein
MGIKEQVLQHTVRYAASVVLAQVALFFGGFAIARFLGPTHYGLWNGLQLILLYASYSQLGIVNALNRELPLRRGKGDLAQAERIRSTTLGAVLVTALVAGAAILAYSMIATSRHSPLTILGLRFVGLLVILQQIYGYSEICFRTNHEFGIVGKLRLFRTVLEVSLAVLLTYAFDLAGRLWAATLTFIVILAYIFRRHPVPFRPAFDPKGATKLIAIGFPIMLVGLVSGVYQSIDRVLILAFLNPTHLGYYAIGLTAASVLGIIPGVVGEILYPRFAERYGETNSPSQLKEYVLTPTYLLAHLLPLFLGMVYLLIPYVILTALPRYAPAIRPARILVLGTFFLAVAGSASDFLNTINRQVMNLVAQIASLAIAVSSTYAFLRLGWGIQGVALATVLTSLLYSIALLGYVLLRHFETPIDTLKSLWNLYLPFGYCLALLLLVDLIPLGAVGQGVPSFPAVLLKVVIFALFILPLIARANRRASFLPELFGLLGGLRRSVLNR